MSSRLSIPVVSSDTVANISTYLSNNDTTSFVNIFGDSDWSITNNIAYYKTLPVFSGTKVTTGSGKLHNDINLLGKNDSMMVKVGGDKAVSYSESRIEQRYVYIYNFNSFIIICFGDDFTNYKNAKFTGVTPFSSIVLIDKINSELFVTNSNTYYNDSNGVTYYEFKNPSTFIGGLPAIKFGGAEPIYTNTVLMDGDADYYHQSWSMTSKRTVDSVNAVFYKQLFTDGTETSRMYFFTSFPAGSTFETLHIDNKYYFILPYPETQTVRNTTGGSMEGWCALGIDVTDDIAEQE